LLLLAPDEISFLRVQSMDARSYGRGSSTSSSLSSASSAVLTFAYTRAIAQI